MDTLFLLKAAWASHWGWALLYSLPFLFLGALFIKCWKLEIKSRNSPPTTGPNAGFAEFVISILFITSGLIFALSLLAYPFILKGIDLKPQYINPMATKIYGEDIEEIRSDNKGIVRIFSNHMPSEYISFKRELGKQVPIDYMIKIEQINKLLEPNFKSCYTMPIISGEMSVNTLKRELENQKIYCAEKAATDMVNSGLLIKELEK